MIEPVYPENISDEQQKWNVTAEGLLRRLLWQIETGEILPKEMIIAFVDRRGGGQTFCLETTATDVFKLQGIMFYANHTLAERVGGTHE